MKSPPAAALRPTPSGGSSSRTPPKASRVPEQAVVWATVPSKPINLPIYHLSSDCPPIIYLSSTIYQSIISHLTGHLSSINHLSIHLSMYSSIIYLSIYHLSPNCPSIIYHLSMYSSVIYLSIHLLFIYNLSPIIYLSIIYYLSSTYLSIIYLLSINYHLSIHLLFIICPSIRPSAHHPKVLGKPYCIGEHGHGFGCEPACAKHSGRHRWGQPDWQAWDSGGGAEPGECALWAQSVSVSGISIGARDVGPRIWNVDDGDTRKAWLGKPVPSPSG